MRIPHVRALLACLLVLGLAVVPAAAEDPDPPEECYQTDVDEDGEPTGPEFCTLDTWFTDSGTKAGNVAATGGTDYPTWDTEEPNASVAAGAGGGYFGNGTLWQLEADRDPTVIPTFEGEFTGNIDNLVITMYMFTAADPDEGFLMGARLLVDGEEAYVVEEATVPLESGGDAVMRTTFALDGVHDAMTSSFRGFPDDAADETRTVTLQLAPYAIATTTAILVYDTTEVPSSLTFNAPDLEGLTTLRGF